MKYGENKSDPVLAISRGGLLRILGFENENETFKGCGLRSP